MCGIAGVIFKKAQRPEQAREYAELLAEAIAHRGPDDHGGHIDPEGRFAFVNVRLAIVDRAGGHQPMYTDNRKIGIVFNGEIYNYVELRAELMRNGVRFVTNSDTEVILRCYEHFGIDAFDKLNGMFAFCIWDERNDETYLVRDHLGIKPLYIYEDADKYLFCSEVKGIASIPNVDLKIDPIGTQDYLTFRYIQAPYTIFKQVRCLEAGTFLRLRRQTAARFRYWDIEYPADYPVRDVEEIVDLLGSSLKQAVSSQLMGEVPIGVLLSGGVDSSGIAALVKESSANLTTFNIGFSDVNEFEYSRAVASELGLKHVEIVTTPEELASLLDEVVLALDHPIADPACFPLYRLSKELKEHVTVVLSGEGGDELFAGYPQHHYLYTGSVPYSERFETFLTKSWYFNDARDFLRDESLSPVFTRHRKYFEDLPILHGMLAYDVKTWLPENLMMKADKILMAHSLEGRFPFLDKDLVRLASRIPQTLKISDEGATKWILKETLKHRLPTTVLQRPKMGFSVPLSRLLKSWKELVLDTIATLNDSGLGDVLLAGKIKHRVQEYYRNGTGEPLQVWTFFVLAYWYQAALPSYRARRYRSPTSRSRVSA